MLVAPRFSRLGVLQSLWGIKCSPVQFVAYSIKGIIFQTFYLSEEYFILTFASFYCSKLLMVIIPRFSRLGWLIHLQGIGVVMLNGNNFCWAFLFLTENNGRKKFSSISLIAHHILSLSNINLAIPCSTFLCLFFLF